MGAGNGETTLRPAQRTRTNTEKEEKKEKKKKKKKKKKKEKKSTAAGGSQTGNAPMGAKRVPGICTAALTQISEASSEGQPSRCPVSP